MPPLSVLNVTVNIRGARERAAFIVRIGKRWRVIGWLLRFDPVCRLAVWWAARGVTIRPERT